MHIVAISDMHGRLPKIPPCDVLLIGGDTAPEASPGGITIYDPDLIRLEQEHWFNRDYRPWEEQVPAKHILATTGNHDWFTHLNDSFKTRLFIDAGCEIDGKSFYFMPWVPLFGPWNYMLDRADRKARYADIPKNLDVLISHGPAYDVLDRMYGGDAMGCPELRAAILNKKPKHCIFGHIHEAQRFGCEAKLGNTVMHHVSLWNYDTGMRVGEVNPNWKPVEFDL